MKTEEILNLIEILEEEIEMLENLEKENLEEDDDYIDRIIYDLNLQIENLKEEYKELTGEEI